MAANKKTKGSHELRIILSDKAKQKLTWLAEEMHVDSISDVIEHSLGYVFHRTKRGDVKWLE